MLAAGEPIRDEHDVAGTVTRRAVGDAQIAVQCIARLRKHGRLNYFRRQRTTKYTATAANGAIKKSRPTHDGAGSFSVGKERSTVVSEYATRVRTAMVTGIQYAFTARLM